MSSEPTRLGSIDVSGVAERERQCREARASASSAEVSARAILAPKHLHYGGDLANRMLRWSFLSDKRGSLPWASLRTVTFMLSAALVPPTLAVLNSYSPVLCLRWQFTSAVVGTLIMYINTPVSLENNSKSNVAK